MHIYINLILIHTMIYHFFNVLVNDKGGGGSRKKIAKCDIRGRGVQKMSFCTNICF